MIRLHAGKFVALKGSVNGSRTSNVAFLNTDFLPASMKRAYLGQEIHSVVVNSKTLSNVLHTLYFSILLQTRKMSKSLYILSRSA